VDRRLLALLIWIKRIDSPGPKRWFRMEYRGKKYTITKVAATRPVALDGSVRRETHEVWCLADAARSMEITL